MHVRQVALRQHIHRCQLSRQPPSRYYSTSPPLSKKPIGPSQPYNYEKPASRQSWLTRQVKQSPWATKLFLNFSSVLGYGNAKQIAGRRTLAIYEQICSRMAEEDRAFWQDECDMPPTFQSWFTITNLHIWLVTTRLRALPPPHGNIHIQALIDHFFLDVEDRIRTVLRPIDEDPPQSSFYSAPTDDKTKTTKRKRGRAPDRQVSQHMRILKEQWTGLGMSFDLGLVKGDNELAAAVWRNLLGARGARGIPYPTSGVPAPGFRRSINPLGSSTSKSRIKLLESGIEAEEAKDDGSGVHDYHLDKIDKYVFYPQLMLDIIQYIRKELKRLEAVRDEDIIGRTDNLGKTDAGLEILKFGKVRG